MEQLLTVLYVRDMLRMRDFYKSLLVRDALIDVPGMCTFNLGGAQLGLMPQTGIRQLLPQLPAFPAHVSAPCELYLSVTDPQDWLDRACHFGARLLSPLQARDWGDEVAYAQDPEGHVLAFARSLD